MFGWVAGESAAQDIKALGNRPEASEPESLTLELLRAIRGRERDTRHATWQEANCAIQQIMATMQHPPLGKHAEGGSRQP